MLAEACAQSTADYRSTHRGQLVDVSKSGHSRTDRPSEWPLGRFGGILLPVSRNFNDDLPGLALAVQLALSHQCQLVVICSKNAVAADFPKPFKTELELAGLLLLVDLAQAHSDWLPRLESSVNPLSKLERSNDVGPKRNIGLALAAFLGWQYLLFMDDDIAQACGGATLNTEYLSHSIGAMQRDPLLAAVGWTLEDFDDNSVVGHARPLLGMPQGIFIGAGALLVRCGPRLPFFPDIYNEDWLFLMALAAAAPEPRRALGWCGRVRQRGYEPFHSRRAKSEEAGEIVGEGLMNLFEDHGAAYFERAMAPRYWRSVLQGRWRLLNLIKAEAGRRLSPHLPEGEEVHRRLVEAMTAAQGVHPQLKPMDLVSYVRTWRNDEKNWQSHLLRLTSASAQFSRVAPPTVRLDASPASQRRACPGTAVESFIADQVPSAASVTTREPVGV